MMLYPDRIDPKIDFAFKRIFGTEDNKDILVDLINSILDPADRVSEVLLCSPFTAVETALESPCIFDIRARGENGYEFNIKIQLRNQDNYAERSLFYWAKSYTEQLNDQRKIYSSLSKTIGIHFLGFEIPPNTKSYHNIHEMIQIHTIELPRFSKGKEQYASTLAKANNALDFWSTFLIYYREITKESIPQRYNQLSIQKAINIMDRISQDPQERSLYQQRQEALRRANADLAAENQRGEKKEKQ